MGVSTQILEDWECDVCRYRATLNASHKHGHSAVDGWKHIVLEIPNYNVDKVLLCPICVKKLGTKWGQFNFMRNDVLPFVLNAYSELIKERKEEKEKEEEDRRKSPGVMGTLGAGPCPTGVIKKE